MMQMPPIGLEVIDQSPKDGIYYGYLLREKDKVGFSAWRGVPGGAPGKLYVFFIKGVPKNEVFLMEAKDTLWTWIKYVGFKEYFSGVKIYGG